MSVPYTADNWPIAGAMLPFPGTNTQGTHINDADSSVWAAALTEVKEAMYPRTFRASAVPHFRGVAATLGSGTGELRLHPGQRHQSHV